MENFLKECEFYGFSGKIGSGKDFLAGVLSQMLPYKNTLFVAIADVMKIDGIVKDNLDRNKVYGQKDEHTRNKLQLRGTEEGRNKYGEDIWIRTIVEWIIVHASRGIRRFFITDIRFSNEMQFFLRLGYVFRIISPQRTSDRLDQEVLLQGITKEHPDFEKRKLSLASHTSETALDNFTSDSLKFILIDNDPKQNSIEKLREFALNLYPPITLIKNENTLAKDILPELTYFVDLDDTICYCERYYTTVQKSVAICLNVPFEDFNEMYKTVNCNWETDPFYRDSFSVCLMETALRFAPKLGKSERDFIYTLGISVHEFDFEEIPEAVEAVKKLKTGPNCRIVIFTIGCRADQLRKICKLGLHTIVDAVEVSDMKDVSLFRMLKLKYPAKKYCMFGDSLRRDVEPAKAAGIDYVYHVTKDKPLSQIVGDLLGDTQ